MDDTNPEYALALAYAPADRRAGFSALMALDTALADVVRTTSQPAIGQIRLAWWHNQLAALGTAEPPAMPVLRDLAADALPHLDREAVAAIVEGWDVLIEEDRLDEPALSRFAHARGAALFRLAATMLDAPHAGMEAAGEGWALADLADHLSDADERTLAQEMARARLSGSLRAPRRLQPLGILALGARLDLDGVAPGSPRRAARLAWYGLTAR